MNRTQQPYSDRSSVIRRIHQQLLDRRFLTDEALSATQIAFRKLVRDVGARFFVDNEASASAEALYLLWLAGRTVLQQLLLSPMPGRAPAPAPGERHSEGLPGVPVWQYRDRQLL